MHYADYKKVRKTVKPPLSGKVKFIEKTSLEEYRNIITQNIKIAEELNSRKNW